MRNKALESQFSNCVANSKIWRLSGWLALMLVCSAMPVVSQTENNENLPIPVEYKVEGIPPIKKSEVENLFYDPTSIKSNLVWDADAATNRLLVTDKKNTVYLLDAPLAAPVEILEKRVPLSVRMRPDGAGFAFNDDSEDADNFQLHFYDFKAKSFNKVAALTGKDESVDSFAWNKTGSRLYFAKVDYEAKTSRLCESDLSSERCFSVELKGIWNVADADGDQILLKHLKASSSQLLYVFDQKTNKLSPIDERGNSRKAFVFGENVYWLTEGNPLCGDNACVLRLDLKNGAVKRLGLPEDLTNFNDVKFSPGGKNLLVQETKDGTDRLRVFKLKNDILKAFPAFVTGSFVIWDVRWMGDDTVVYTLENNGKPTSIHSFNLATQKRIDWTKERLPAQLAGKVKAPEGIRWKSFDGREISGYIVRPQTSTLKKTPVLIFVHGGPQILDKPVFNTGDIRLAANLGLTIIHTNIRGSSGFGKEFMDADNGAKRADAIKDVQALLDWVEKQPGLNHKQIYLRGESYGGFVVLATALNEPKRIKAVIAEYPLVSIRSFLSQSWIDEFAKNEYGDPKDESLMSKTDALSPLNNASRWNNIPLFLTRGKLDQRSPEQNVIDLKNQLQNRGAEVWFIYSEEDGHGVGGKYVTVAMHQFLKKQLNKER